MVIVHQEHEKQVAQYKADLAEWSRTTGKSPPKNGNKKGQRPEWLVVPVGQEEVFLGHFRAAAAVALGRINDQRAHRILAEALMQDGQEWGTLIQDPNALARMIEFSDLHKGMAIMSLARSGDAGSVPALVEILEGRIPNLAGYSPERLKDSPLRGYA